MQSDGPEVDLSAPDMLEVLAEKHAGAHEVIRFEKEILSLARATLETPVMQRAAVAEANGRTWRESYVSSPVGDNGVVLEGFVDLMFEDDDKSIVIVDYKTDRTIDAVEGYEMQLGAYVAAVRKATGREVKEAVLVFSRRASEALAAGHDLKTAEHRVSDIEDAVDRAIEQAERSMAG